MNKESGSSTLPAAPTSVGNGSGEVVTLSEHIVEIVSDSGEGAQKAGQTFGTVCAKMGNGVWTVEIIPAEIKPPARSRQGASGIRIRLGSHAITNMGNTADLVVAFNEQVLYDRLKQQVYRPGTIILLENRWAEDPDVQIREQYAEALREFKEAGLVVHELPLEEACLEVTDNPRLGKNMFVLGMLCEIYQCDIEKASEQIGTIFARKSQKVVDLNRRLLQHGVQFARDNLPYRYHVPSMKEDRPLVVLNGNQAIGLGVMAAGIELVAMYPITPATSASHYLAGAFPSVGGFVHQAEDEIAAVGFAVGAAYAGKTTCTITSGPGLSLKQEMIGLAVMCEIPMVIVNVQRGGPSTGLPTKVEQGDLMCSIFGGHGDAPKVVMAAATIEECIHMVVTARKMAEAFRVPVLILTDANLATGVTAVPRPQVTPDWLSPPIDQSPWQKSLPPYDWDEETGLSPRPIPGQKDGMYVLTGLAHNEMSKVAYDPASNQKGCDMRSRKMSTIRRTLTPPQVHGAPEGDLLVVGWGSTLGAIEEAVDQAREEGHRVSSLHLRFLNPLEPGLPEIFAGYKQVMTVELNYSDDPDAPGIDPQYARPSQLAYLLRAETLHDVRHWSVVRGKPIRPDEVHAQILRALGQPAATSTASEEG